MGCAVVGSVVVGCGAGCGAGCGGAAAGYAEDSGDGCSCGEGCDVDWRSEALRRSKLKTNQNKTVTMFDLDRYRRLTIDMIDHDKS